MWTRVLGLGNQAGRPHNQRLYRTGGALWPKEHEAIRGQIQYLTHFLYLHTIDQTVRSVRNGQRYGENRESETSNRFHYLKQNTHQRSDSPKGEHFFKSFLKNLTD